MKMKSVFILLLLFSTMILIGCYTKFGYYEASFQPEKQQKHADINKEEMEQTTKTETENSDESDGYYGRRKRTYGSSRYNVHNSYWIPYTSHPYAYYQPMYYYPNPWYYGNGYGYYGYRSPYYRYYGGYSPYRSYYGGYRGSSFLPANRSTFKRGAVLNRSENRRARTSRSVTSSNSRSERPKRRTRNSE